MPPEGASGTYFVSSGVVEFRELLRRHIRELEDERPAEQSTDWFFLRYLRRLQRRALAQPRARDCEGLMRGLTRFYVDHVEEGSALAERFEDILETHRYALRRDHAG